MVTLYLNIGRSYDGYGEQIVKREKVILTDEEASSYLTYFVEGLGVEETKKWIKEAKGNTDT